MSADLNHAAANAREMRASVRDEIAAHTELETADVWEILRRMRDSGDPYLRLISRAAAVAMVDIAVKELATSN